MSTIDRQIALVRRRLTLNLLLDRVLWMLALAAVAGTGVILVERAFAFGIPLPVALGVVGGVALILAVALTLAARADRLMAAIEIDRAAGLKARVGSAVALSPHSADPFVSATIRDAEQVAARVHVPAHVPYRMSPRWPGAVAGLFVIVLTYAFMPTLDLLAAPPAPTVAAAPVSQTQREQAETIVQEVAQRTRERLNKLPGFDGLDQEVGALDIPDDPTMTPDDINREVAKRTQNVAEKLRDRLDETELKALTEMERQLARLETPEGSDPAAELSKALSQGDTQAAKQALEQLQQQLQDAQQNASPEQQEALAEAARKLGELSKQLEQVASDEASQKELENKAGLGEEQAKELLEQMQGMTKEQIEQLLKKQLGENGQVTQEQIKQMARKIAQNQQAKQQLKQMAKAMQQAAQACQNSGSGQGEGQGSAASGMAAAMDQLSQMEMAQQMMAELEAALDDIEGLQQQAQGGGMCQNPGNRPGPPGNNVGKGYGPIDKKAAAHGYKSTRVRGEYTAGQIIGQMLVDGPMTVGEASEQVRDTVGAAVRDATDAIDREEVPRQYHSLLRNYFASLAGLAGDAASEPPADGARDGAGDAP